MAVIEVHDLYKSYGRVAAVRGISFSVKQGEVVALLGPNGAGKSTTVEILEGHRAQTSGSVSVLGVDPASAGRDFRDRIGIVLQSSGIEDELTARETLEMYGSAYSNPLDPDKALGLVGLTGVADQRVSQLSGGQMRRIDLALGIVGDPEVLFLDEPTTGFDPAARRRAWDLIDGLRDLGTTILLTTHYMDEAQRLADRVAVIVGGEIVAGGTPAQLTEAAGETVITFRIPGDLIEDDAWLAGIPLIDVLVAGASVRAHTKTPTRALYEVTGWALEKGIELVDLCVSRPSLEDVYLGLANESEDL